ncbi:hypothetical protein SynMITS9220_02939 [Synechococcus sp. MIT S9220]|nr:hypothetical protein SynMITS9220_02939 [Synechococcus sp. MIT S9220]
MDTIGLDGDERAFGGHEKSESRSLPSSVLSYPLGKQDRHLQVSAALKQAP